MQGAAQAAPAGQAGSMQAGLLLGMAGCCSDNAAGSFGVFGPRCVVADTCRSVLFVWAVAFGRAAVCLQVGLVVLVGWCFVILGYVFGW